MPRSLDNEQDDHFLLANSSTDVIPVKCVECLHISSSKFGPVNAGKQILGAQGTAAEMSIEINECHE